MKLPQKSKKRLLVIIFGFIAACAIGLSYYVFGLNGSLFGWRWQDQTSDQSQSINTEPSPEKSTPSDTNTSGGSAKERAVEDAGKDEKAADSLAVSFTAINQADGMVRIRVKIDQLISSGTCTLTLQKGMDTVTKTAPVAATASISTCQGFDIPTSELSPGAWSATVNVSAEKATGTASSSITVE